MKIYICKFGNIKNVPSNVLPVAICDIPQMGQRSYKKFYVHHMVSKLSGNKNWIDEFDFNDIMNDFLKILSINPGYDNICLVYNEMSDNLIRIITDWLSTNDCEYEELKPLQKED